MDIQKWVDDFTMSSKSYRMLVIATIALIFLALWLRHQVNFSDESAQQDTFSTQTEEVLDFAGIN